MSKALWLRINICFKCETKEHSVIISRSISSQISTMYIDTYLQQPIKLTDIIVDVTIDPQLMLESYSIDQVVVIQKG